MDDLITIIINVYNDEKHIKKCVESAINQTYKNLEILVIDDGSTDRSLDICKGFADERIKIITQRNMGLSLARNVGIENAKGEYLYFIDSDDFIEEDTIEYLYNLTKKYNVSVATAKTIDIYDYDYKIKNQESKEKILSTEEMLIKVLFDVDRSGTIWNKLIKKDLFKDVRFQDRIINDVVVTYKIIILSEKIAFANQIKYYYLRHKNAITSRKRENTDRSIDLYEAGLERYNFIKDRYPTFIENEIGMARLIADLYTRNNEFVHKYLNEKKAMNLFKGLFSFNKILKCKISVKEKIKISLFAINPKICKFVIRKYKKIKEK